MCSLSAYVTMCWCQNNVLFIKQCVVVLTMCYFAANLTMCWCQNNALLLKQCAIIKKMWCL